MNTPEHENITADTFDLMDWITSGTVGRREVTIYNDVEAGQRIEAIDGELAALNYTDDEPEHEDGPLSGRGGVSAEVQALLDEQARLLERLQASKAVWTVRALSGGEVEEAFDAIPDPPKPVPPPTKSSTPPKVVEELNEKFTRAVEKWSRAAAEANRERRLHMISMAVVGVETPRGAIGSVTADQVRALRDRPHGVHWVDTLWAGISAASESDVAVPRPTLPGRSTITQG